MEYTECLKSIQNQYLALQQELSSFRPMNVAISSLDWLADSLKCIVDDPDSPRDLATQASVALNEYLAIKNSTTHQTIDFSELLHNSINSIIEIAVREGYVQ